MQTERKVGNAPRTMDIVQKTVTINGPCIGCSGCQGLCQALIEAMTLPEIILTRS